MDENLKRVAQPSQSRFITFVVLYLVVACLLGLLGIVHTPCIAADSNILHTSIEITSGIIAMTSGIACMLYFLGLQNRYYMTIGLGFIVAGSQGLMHGLIAWNGVGEHFVLDPSRVVPVAHLLGRCILAVMIIVAAGLESLIEKVEKVEREAWLFSIIAFMLGTSATAVVSVQSLPKFIFPDQLITRPYDLGLAGLFLLAFILTFQRFRQRVDIFSGMLVFSILLLFASQAYLGFAQKLYCSYSELAHWFNFFAYLMPLVGIAIHGLEEIKRARREIEARHRAEEELERMHAMKSKEASKLRSMIEGMDEGVVVADSKNIITEVNDWFLQKVNLQRHEILGKHIDCFHPNSPTMRRVQDIIEEFRCRTRRETYIVERELMGMQVSLRIQPIFDKDEYRGVILNVVNVTDLVKARLAAEEATRTKSEFIANISHEIRTPMNGVLGITGFLLESDLTSEQRRYVETIRSSANSLLTLINEVLDFSKMEAGKLVIELAAFDLRLIIEEMLELLVVRSHEKNVILILDFPPDVPRNVTGDPGRIRQVLLNLVGNAVKFTSQGHILLQVRYEKATSKRLNFYFAVQDTGIGIPEDKIDYVFDKFTQINSPSPHKFGGTGLGLSIARQLVNLMQGEIGVFNNSEGGSTFWFRIPLEVTQGSYGTVERPQEIFADMSILLVDTYPLRCEVLATHLRHWGINCTIHQLQNQVVPTLLKAHIEGQPYQLVIIDVDLPNMQFEKILQEIQQYPILRNTCILAMVPSGRKGTCKNKRFPNLIGYLLSPFREAQLVKRLKDVTRIVQHGELISDDTAVNQRHATEAHQPLYAWVLVAEDNIINQKVAVEMLTRIGCRVDVAINGQEAVDMARKFKYDLIFMDCQMPEKDGYTATREIRKLEGTKFHTPIVAMTAYAIQGDSEKCLRAGMDDYIAKPVDKESIRKLVIKWVPEARRRQKSADFQAASLTKQEQDSAAGAMTATPPATEHQGTPPVTEPQTTAYQGGPPATALEGTPATTAQSLPKCDSSLPSSLPPFDPLRPLKDLDGDLDTVKELLQMFVTTTSDDIKRLHEYIATGEQRQIARLAHSMKSAAAYAGAEPIRESAALIEKAASHGQSENVRINLKRLTAEFEQLQQYLEGFDWDAITWQAESSSPHE